MKLVDTADIEGSLKTTKYARTSEGTIDYSAYIGLDGRITINKLDIMVKIIDARKRFGHLDLLVVPAAGTGEVWIERKNIIINNDPGLETKSVAKDSGTVVPEMTLDMVKDFLKSQNLSISVD
jgi:hypothetical protein